MPAHKIKDRSAVLAHKATIWLRLDELAIVNNLAEQASFDLSPFLRRVVLKWVLRWSKAPHKIPPVRTGGQTVHGRVIGLRMTANEWEALCRFSGESGASKAAIIREAIDMEVSERKALSHTVRSALD